MKRVILTRPERKVDDAYVRAPLRATVDKTNAGNTHPSPLLPIGREEGRGITQPDVERERKELNVSLGSVLSLADKLSSAERKTLLAHLALQTHVTVEGQDRDKDMWAQAVYNELVRAFGRGDGAGQGPALVKRALASHSAWTPVAAFMESSGLADLTVTERSSVYGLVAKLCVENALYVARKIGAPLSAKLVGACSANVASLFDNAFPGYLAAGLAPIVARQLTQARPAA